MERDSIDCGFCEETVYSRAAGHCRGCSSDGSVVPLCSKCAAKHTQPDKFKRTKGHDYTLIENPCADHLRKLGLPTFGQEFCSDHPGELLRQYCREGGCGVAACGLCAPRHAGHALEDITIVSGSLRSELAMSTLASSCWAEPLSQGSTPAPIDERRSAALLADVDAPAAAEAEIVERLTALAAVQSELDESEARAAAEATAAFDEATRLLGQLREASLGGLRTAVAARRTELAAESQLFEAAHENISRLVSCVRSAVQFLSPEQLGSLYPALSGQIRRALAEAGRLPQGRLQNASVSLDLSRVRAVLAAGQGDAPNIGVSVTRELAAAELQSLTTADLAAAILTHLAGPAATLLRCIQALCLRSDKGRGAASVPQDGSLPALARVLQERPEDAELSASSLRALRFLVRDPENRRLAVIGGAMRTLVSVLQRQNVSPSVVENACWSLHNLTAVHDEEGSREVLSGSTEDAATASAFLVRGELLVTHAAHAPIAEAALWALATLPTAPDIGNPSPTSTFANATLRIVTTLSAHSSSASAAEGALWALYNYSKEPNALVAVAAHASATVITALSVHAAHLGVTESGVYVLDSMSSLPSAASGAAPYVIALVAALTTHGASSVTLASAACHALGNFTLGEVGAASAVSSGVVPALLTAVAAHPNALGVAEGACRALRGLYAATAAVSAASLDSPTVALRSDAVVAIVEVLRVHKAAPAVAEQAAWALVNLVAGSDAAAVARKAAAIRVGVFALLSDALRIHATAVGVVFSSLWAIWSLATTDEARTAAAAASVIPAIVRAFTSHPTTTSVSETGSRALWAVCAANDANKSVAKLSGAPAALQTIKSRQGGTVAAELASKALDSLGDLSL